MTQDSFDFIDETIQECQKCNQTKSLTEFYKNPKMATGRFKVCKPCYTLRECLKDRLKLGFASLMTDYCECCGITNEKIQLDHCHETNKFRGFICRSCNMTLGNNGDTYASIKEADWLDEIYLSYMRIANYRMGEILK
tara:strand:- start:209 stop:622 length:414 start_codon:yes stop_codon:yes gene_type:complete